VAGDGLHWVVAYHQRTSLVAPATDVYCRWVTFEPVTDAAYVGGGVLVEDGPAAQTVGSVALRANASLLVLSRSQASAGGVHALSGRSLDLFSCAQCEGRFDLDVVHDVLGVASTSHPFAGAMSLMAWESVDTGTGIGEIRARGFVHAIGDATGLVRTACGPDVQVYGTCARASHPDFHLRLEHAEPRRPAVLLLRPGWMPTSTLRCAAACDILDPFRSFCLPAGVTDDHGDLAVPLAIPSDPTQAWSFQFGLVPASAPGCPVLQVSFSRIGNLTIHVD
jgi:hypothetical protein